MLRRAKNKCVILKNRKPGLDYNKIKTKTKRDKTQMITKYSRYVEDVSKEKLNTICWLV